MSEINHTQQKIDTYVMPVEANWAVSVRERALNWIVEHGLPNRKDEYWKYTDPKLLNSTKIPEINEIDSIENSIFDKLSRINLVFNDGLFDASKSDDIKIAGIEIEPLVDANQKTKHWSKDYYGALEKTSQDPVVRTLASLNTAFATQGLTIKVTKKISLPISITYLHSRETSDILIHHVVKVEKNAGITLLESGGVGSRSNSVIEVSVCENAKFDHVRIQGRSHEKVAVTHLFANLLENSSMKSFTLTVNGKCIRNEYFIDINGENTKAHLGGAAVGDRGFSQDDTVFVSHNSPNCESRQVFKKVLRNGAKGVFQGKILVKEGAQKTDGYQISQGLMLDDDSNFLAKPELEIYADDVVCSHGSTCGEIDDNALFYLTSRGIPIAEAQDMLVLAFLNEAIDEITGDDIKEIIANRLKDWMVKRHKL